MTATKVVVSGAVKAVLALFGSFVVWCWGFFAAHEFDNRSAGVWCGETATRRLTLVTQHFFLPSAVCRFSDGSSRQLVPRYLVPLMFLLVALAIYFVAEAIHKLNKYELWS